MKVKHLFQEDDHDIISNYDVNFEDDLPFDEEVTFDDEAVAKISSFLNVDSDENDSVKVDMNYMKSDEYDNVIRSELDSNLLNDMDKIIMEMQSPEDVDCTIFDELLMNNNVSLSEDDNAFISNDKLSYNTVLNIPDSPKIENKSIFSEKSGVIHTADNNVKGFNVPLMADNTKILAPTMQEDTNGMNGDDIENLFDHINLDFTIVSKDRQKDNNPSNFVKSGLQENGMAINEKPVNLKENSSTNSEVSLFFKHLSTCMEKLNKNQFIKYINDINPLNELFSKERWKSYIEDEIRTNEISKKTFVKAINNLSKKILTTEKLNAIHVKESERLDLFLALFDGKKVILPCDFHKKWETSITALIKIHKSLEKEKLWKEAAVAQLAGSLKGIKSTIHETKSKKQDLNMKISSPRKINNKVIKKTKINEFSFMKNEKVNKSRCQWKDENETFKPKVNKYPRMESDIEVRKMKINKSKEELKKDIEKDVISKIEIHQESKKILERNGILGLSKEKIYEKLYSSKKNYFQELNSKYEEQNKIDPNTGQKLFHPKINQNSKKFSGEVLSNLYANAIDRMQQKKVEENKMLQEIKDVSSTSKFTKKSLEYLRKRLINKLNTVLDILDTEKMGYVNTIEQFNNVLSSFYLVPRNVSNEMNDHKDQEEDTENNRRIVMISWKVLNHKENAGVTSLKSGLTKEIIIRFVTMIILGIEIYGNEKSDKKWWQLLNVKEKNLPILKEVMKRLNLNYQNRSKNDMNLPISFLKDTKSVDGMDVVKQPKENDILKKKNVKEYSIHGVEINDSPMEARNAKKLRDIDKKLQMLRLIKLESEMKECTFTPSINKINISEDRNNSQFTRNKNMNAFDRLYNEAENRRNQIELKRDEIQKEMENKNDMEDKIIHESTNNKTAMERWEIFKIFFSQNNFPKNYEKKIQMMRDATTEREIINNRLQRPFSPLVDTSLFREHETGKIIPIPFILKTEERSSKRKDAFSVKHLKEPDEQENKVLLCTCVLVSPTRQVKFILRKNENIKNVLEIFCEKYRLTPAEKKDLVQRVKSILYNKRKDKLDQDNKRKLKDVIYYDEVAATSWKDDGVLLGIL